MISSELPNILLPNLVWWCIILSQIVFQKDWVCCLQVQGHSEGLSSELLILLHLNLVWWHIIISWIFLWKDWISLLWSRSRSQERFKILVIFHTDNISLTAEPSATRLDMVMHHQGPECHARRLVCCLQFKVTVRAHVNKYDFLPYLLNWWSFCNQI